jgi:RNA polymerase sigma-70 factor, ECF subfamily
MDSQELEKQFMDIVTRNKQIIYKVCYIYATDNDNLNDLYQEVVINLWKAFPRFRGECKEST